MPRAQRILMAALVATALTAGRLADAAPALRTPVTQSAIRFAGRLVVSLRRTIPSVRLREFRRDETIAAASVRPAQSEPLPLIPFDASPAQYRLPPPSL
jgi:hypothetical protein